MTNLPISFVSTGFPDKDWIEELFYYITVLFCVFPTWLGTFSTFSLFSMFNLKVLLERTLVPICAESAVRSKSANLFFLVVWFFCVFRDAVSAVLFSSNFVVCLNSTIALDDGACSSMA